MLAVVLSFGLFSFTRTYAADIADCAVEISDTEYSEIGDFETPGSGVGRTSENDNTEKATEDSGADRVTFTFDGSETSSGLSWNKYFNALCSVPTDPNETAHASLRAEGTPYYTINSFMQANRDAALDNLYIEDADETFITYFLNTFGASMYILDGGKEKAYDLWNGFMPGELSVTYSSDGYSYVSAGDQNILTQESYVAALNALNDYLVHGHYNYAYNTYNENRYDEQLARYLTLEEAVKNIVFVSDEYDVAEFKKAGIAPSRPGFLFAGWFSDAEKTVPYTESTGTAYAKFVDEDVLTIKAQMDDRKNSLGVFDLRLISTLDTVAYSEAGFIITFDGKTVVAPVHYAYGEITANDGAIRYYPSDISPDSEFFITYAVVNIPYSVAHIPFKVTAYFKTLDGTFVSGKERLVYVENGELIPVTRDMYYIYNNLDEKYRDAYDRFYEGILACERPIDFSSYLLTAQEFFDNIFLGVVYDSPELWWFTNSYSYSTVLRDGSVYIGKVYPEYSFTGEELEQKKLEIEERIEKLLEGISSSMSEYEREVIIHDRFLKDVSYTFSDHDQSAYGSLVEGAAVCAGYAKGLQYLLYRAGIVSTYITGEASGEDGNLYNHAWLLVRIDGEYYFCDPTWADQDSINAIFHEYMNITTEELLKSRTLEAMPWTIPNCISTKANYWHVEDKISNGFELEKAARCLREDGFIELHIIGDTGEFWTDFKANRSAVLQAAGYDPTLTCSGFTLGNEFYITVNPSSSLSVAVSSYSVRRCGDAFE